MEVPSISTKVGFAPEFLPAEALMETHSVPELVRGLKLALADLSGLRERLRPSFELVANEVTLDAMVAKVLGVYGKVLAA
jgi:hypothetical protein